MRSVRHGRRVSPGTIGVRRLNADPAPIRIRADAGRSQRRGDRGQALVELAIVTPVLALLLLAAVDLGRIFYLRVSVANAAREGAMVAAQEPGSYTAGADCSAGNKVTCAAINEANGVGITVVPADVALTCSPSCSCTFGATVEVAVTGHFQLLTPLLAPFFGGQSIAFTERASADVIILPAAAGYATPSPTPTPTPSPTPTPTPGVNPTPTPTATPSPTPSPTPSCASPIVHFTYTQQNKTKPVVFTSTSTPTTGSCAITYWRWEFGDNTTDAGAQSSVSHMYPASGATYQVILTVTTPGGTYSFTASVTTR